MSNSGQSGAIVNPGSRAAQYGAGAGSLVQNNGSGNAASSTAANATVVGENNQLSGEASFAEGTGNVETVVSGSPPTWPLPANHLEGTGNSITSPQIGISTNNHVEGNANTLTGANVNTAPIDYNHVEGNQNVLTATGSGVEFNHVEGNQNTLEVPSTSTGACSFNHVEGSGNTLNVGSGGDIEFTHVEGSGHTLTSATGDIDTAHIEGFGHVVDNADTSHIEGNQHTINTTGFFVHVEGNKNSVTGASTGSHVEGQNCSTTANTTHVEGDYASAIRETQYAKASGKFSVAGDSQTCMLVLRGSTPGSVANESVELKYGDAGNQELTLEDDKYYAFDVSVTAVKTGGSVASMFRIALVGIYQESGTATLVAAGATDNVNVGSGASSWTITATAGSSPSRLVITFATGAGVTAAVRVVATVRWTEVTRN